MEHRRSRASLIVYPAGGSTAGRARLRILVTLPPQEARKEPESAIRRTPLAIERPDAPPLRVEAVGLSERGRAAQLSADVSLPPGRYRLRREDGEPVLLEVLERGLFPLRQLCGHGRFPSSWLSLSAFSPGGEALVALNEIRLSRCCVPARGTPSPKASYPLVLARAGARPERFLVEGRETEVRPGEYLLVNPASRLTPPAGRPVHLRRLAVHQAVLRPFRDAVGLPRALGRFDFDETPREVTPELGVLIGQVEAAVREANLQGNAYGATIAAQQLLLHLLREHPNGLAAKRTRSRDAVPTGPDPRLTLAVRYLRVHYDEPCPVEEVARFAGASVSLLRQLFRRHLGQSPNDYLQGIRIEKAKSLFRDRANTLPKVARAVGYRNVRSFQRLFRAHTGRQVRSFRMN